MTHLPRFVLPIIRVSALALGGSVAIGVGVVYVVCRTASVAYDWCTS